MRKRRGLTQEHVAARMGICVARVSRIESGHASTWDELDCFITALDGTLKLIADFGAEGILSKPRRPVSEAIFSLLAREARTAQQIRGDGEAEAKYDIQVYCDLCGKQLRAGSR